jgi:hypothetical protein
LSASNLPFTYGGSWPCTHRSSDLELLVFGVLLPVVASTWQALDDPLLSPHSP